MFVASYKIRSSPMRLEPYVTEKRRGIEYGPGCEFYETRKEAETAAVRIAADYERPVLRSKTLRTLSRGGEPVAAGGLYTTDGRSRNSPADPWG